jgi:hypothetical protein
MMFFVYILRSLRNGSLYNPKPFGQTVEGLLCPATPL